MTPPSHAVIQIEKRGDPLVFDTPQLLRAWNGQEHQFWQWVHQAPENPYGEITRRQYDGFQSQVEQWVQQWEAHRQNPDFLAQNVNGLQTVFNQYVGASLVIIRETAEAALVEQVRNTNGELAGMAAYSFLTVPSAGRNTFPQPRFFDGLFQAFLFRHEVDWTATAHTEVLTRLTKAYGAGLSDQANRLKEIEEKNTELNANFDSELATKRDSLQNLHVEQGEAFKSLVEKYDADFKQIEETYDQKLALQKPVMYWETKQFFHNRMSKRFGIATAGSAFVLLGLLIQLIMAVFGRLTQGDEPRHYQVGIVAAGVFFVIWFLRIMLRLFFSHVHLAGDAAERRTMILTYLALAREGGDVGPDEKKLILQHLFRTASDGLVKDDATPAGIWEVITRSK